jgi:predicted TIM-barrel fold metal-dependent hydrolase
MGPLTLDTIANRFPNLKVIGAHLGNQGNMEYVASVARWRHHVWFDMSGGATIEDHAVRYNLIGQEIGIEKLVWGSDCGIDVFHEHIARFEAIYDQLGLDDEARDRLWWRNAAEIYGFETPQLASE